MKITAKYTPDKKQRKLWQKIWTKFGGPANVVKFDAIPDGLVVRVNGRQKNVDSCRVELSQPMDAKSKRDRVSQQFTAQIGDCVVAFAPCGPLHTGKGHTLEAVDFGKI